MNDFFPALGILFKIGEDPHSQLVIPDEELHQFAFGTASRIRKDVYSEPIEVHVGLMLFPEDHLAFKTFAQKQKCHNNTFSLFLGENNQPSLVFPLDFFGSYGKFVFCVRNAKSIPAYYAWNKAHNKVINSFHPDKAKVVEELN